MRSQSPNAEQTDFLAPGLREMLNPKEPLYQLAERFPWTEVERSLSKFYIEFGRPAKPIRLMVSLLLLKQMFNLGDETVVAAWVQNPYYQFFSGETQFQWRFPVDPSDLVHFRKRIGQEGIQEIFRHSIALHGTAAQEKVLVADTTVQEKNITFPTDVKLYRRAIEHLWRIADKEGIPLRQRYSRTVRKLVWAQKGKNRRAEQFKKAKKAQRKLKTILGRLWREVLRHLPLKKIEKKYGPLLDVLGQISIQKKEDHPKIYSVHEPEVHCIAKGKEHRKYEFGSKASFLMTKDSCIVVGALDVRDAYDGHTLPNALEQYEELLGMHPDEILVDQGYRGKEIIGNTRIVLASKFREKGFSYGQKYRLKKRLGRRSAIEPVIGHMKSQFRLCRNYLRGVVGDALNAMLAATAFNLVKWMRRLFIALIAWLCGMLETVAYENHRGLQPMLQFST